MLHILTTESNVAWRFSYISSSRDALATGDLPSSSPDFPVRPDWEKDWVPNTGVELSSAYKQVEGKEPDFTNNAKVPTTNRPCRSTTDCTNVSKSTYYTFFFQITVCESRDKPGRSCLLATCSWHCFAHAYIVVESTTYLVSAFFPQQVKLAALIIHDN